MSRQAGNFTSSILAGAVLMAASSGAALAQGASPPDFAPNPSAGWYAYTREFIPPPSGPGPVVNDPAHPHVSNDEFRATGKQPTTSVADLNNPILQPWAREQMRQRNERVLAGKPAFSRQASCWPIGTPGFLLYPVQPVYFVQGPKEVVMIWQADHQIRHIYLNVPHSANPKPSWYGESVGHYEGDTLVVDTIAISTRTFVDNFETPHSQQLHTIERFRMTQGGMGLEASLHVEDPGAFTTPWDAMQRYKRVEPRIAEPKEDANLLSSTADAGPLLESSCAENPNGLFGAEGALPIPQTDKPDF